MKSKIFDVSTQITSTATEVFNSETLGLDVANAVLAGVSITNTGTASIQVQLDIKVHPNGSWIPQAVMGSNNGFIPTNSTNISNSFFKVAIGALNAATIGANSRNYFVANLKYISAFRIFTRMQTGTSGNVVQVRGNISTPGLIDYVEQSFYAVPCGTVTPSTIPTWINVSEYSHLSCTFNFSGSNLFANIPANSLPNQPAATSGYLLAIRFYPDDPIWYYLDCINTASAVAGDKTSQIIRAHTINATDRQVPLLMLTNAAYEIGFLHNIPGGATVDCHVSLNG